MLIFLLLFYVLFEITNNLEKSVIVFFYVADCLIMLLNEQKHETFLELLQTELTLECVRLTIFDFLSDLWYIQVTQQYGYIQSFNIDTFTKDYIFNENLQSHKTKVYVQLLNGLSKLEKKNLLS